MSKKEVKQGVAKNSAFVVAGQFASIFVRFFSNILLAWFLTPADFGIAAIITTILIGLSMLSDVGIQDSVIRSKSGEDPDFYRSAFIVQVIRGVLLYLVILLIADPLASFYGREILGDCLMVGGLSLFFDGFYSTRIYLLQRNHQIKPLVIFEVLTQLISISLVIVICIIHPTVWALIFSHIFNSLLKLAGSHYLAPFSFRGFRHQGEYYKQVLNFGKWIFLATLFQYFITQSDKLILGKVVGGDTLGIYSIASALASISLFLSFSLVLKIVYPVLSEAARHSRQAYSDKVGVVSRQILPVLFIFSVLTFALSPTFFHLFYKQAYSEAGSITQALALMTWFMIIFDIYQKIPVSFGVPSFTAFASFITSALRIIFCLSGFYLFGLYGFIVGLALGSIAGIAVVQFWMYRQDIALSFYEVKLSLAFLTLVVSYYAVREIVSFKFYNEIYGGITIVIVACFFFYMYKPQIMGFVRKYKPS